MSAMTVAQVDNKEVREYRIERFLDLRFSQKEAEELADMTNADGFPVDWHKVRDAVDAGCNHKMALWIFSKED